MNTPLRIIYMGTPEFAVPGLEALVAEGCQIVAVITAPDKPAGRGLQLQMSPVKQAALKLNIPVLQPEKLKVSEFLDTLKSYHADLQIVVAFRMLPEVVWNMPRLGTFNLHASLLPQYRGAAPINWTIINGEKETGVTTFFLKHEIDTGDIIIQERVTIFPSDNVGSLYERLMNIGAQAIVKTVELIQSGNYKTQPQIFSKELRLAPKIFKETCEVEWNKSALEIKNLVRGLSPYPAAWATLLGVKYKIYEVEIVATKSLEIGSVSTDHKTFFHIQTATETIALKVLQAEGKKRMAVEEFLRGNKLKLV